MGDKEINNLDEFLEVLEKRTLEIPGNGKWELDAMIKEQIELLVDHRGEQEFRKYNPITAVIAVTTGIYYHDHDVLAWTEIIKTLGLSDEIITKIFRASNKIPPYDEEVRKKLLKATNLL